MNKYTIVKELINDCEQKLQYYKSKVLITPFSLSKREFEDFNKATGAIMAITGILNKLHKINKRLDMELDEMSDYYAKDTLNNGG